MSLNWGIVSAFAVLFGSVKARKALDRLDEAPPPVPHRVPVPVEPTFPVPNRTRIAHYRKPQLSVVSSIAKATDLFIDWMNGEGRVGLWTSAEIDECWATACVMLDLFPIEPRFIREGLDGRGLKVGQKRLNTPEYLHIKQRTGATRPVLYRIPRCRAQTGIEPERPPDVADSPSSRRPEAGGRADAKTAASHQRGQQRRFA